MYSGQSLSFQVNQVQVIYSNPAPINILLLEPDSSQRSYMKGAHSH